MKNTVFISMMLLSTQAFSQNTLPKPPLTQKDNTVDTYHGKIIADPYRWLEDDNAKSTAQWVTDQNKYTTEYLSKIPFRTTLREELARYWNYTKYSSPFKEGKYYFFYRNDGLQNQSVLYIQEGLNGTPEVFLNPNTMNANGTASLGSVVLSKNQKYCAYSVSNAGSDWQDIYIMDVATKAPIQEVLKYSKFSSIAWVGDEGFFYGGYDAPNEQNKFSAKTEFQKIFFHKIGTQQRRDQLIYEDKVHPLRYKGVGISDDEQWLMLSVSEGTDGNELYYRNLADKTTREFTLLSAGFKTNQDFIDHVDGKFYVYTNYDAPNYKLVSIDPKNPAPKFWKTIIPENALKLDAVSIVGNQIFCNYLENACSKVDVHDIKGNFMQTIQLPGLGTVSGFGGSRKDQHTFYTYTSYNAPPSIFKYDLNTKKSDLFKETNVEMELKNTIVEQIWFVSKDGTKVPMFLYHRKDVNPYSGTHPVLMYGYGGFNISLTPSFNVPMSYFVQQGGIYISVSLRGGGEFGENWHKAGMLEKKQNVFDDFIGAAEYLIRKGITTKELLAIHGRSNGGLLVGACMTQRPDLFKVALPGVGVLDMLRYHKFTVGWGWTVEYGSSDQKKDFDYLIKYSPLHKLEKGVSYPATMVTTADHDDRVVPAHSFKFAAALQDAHKGSNPTLIRIDTQAGHGAGKPTSKQIDEWSDVLSFTMFNLGMKPNK